MIRQTAFKLERIYGVSRTSASGRYPGYRIPPPELNYQEYWVGLGSDACNNHREHRIRYHPMNPFAYPGSRADGIKVGRFSVGAWIEYEEDTREVR